MLNVIEMYHDLKETMDDTAAKKIAGYLGKVYDEVRDTVKTSDFSELKGIVRDLAEAQQRTEVRMENLAEAQQRTETKVEELAEAQKRTETKVEELAGTVEELAEAQQRTEARMEELAEAQQRTEARMEELAEAQQRTEARMEELAEAQQRTEKAVGDLAIAHKSLAQQVGGLSNVLGGDIEDIANSLLFHFLPDEFGWQVGEFERVWKEWGGKTPDEIDMFARATDPKQPDVPIWIVGEAKYNLTIKELKRFIKLIERARQHLEGTVFPLCFCYRAQPDVQQKAREAGIRILFSYGKMI